MVYFVNLLFRFRMNNQMTRPTSDKIPVKTIYSQTQNFEILPSIHKQNTCVSTQNLTKITKSPLDISNDSAKSLNSESLSKNSKKSKSVSNIFETTSVTDIYQDPIDLCFPSLKLSIESMVFGQKLQMNAELLLLSSSVELWPLPLHHLNKVNRDFNKVSDCYEELSLSTKAFRQQIEFIKIWITSWSANMFTLDMKLVHLNDLVMIAITLMELTYQTVYSISSTQPAWIKSPSALLDRKTIISAIDEVELCCFRIREILNIGSFDDENRVNIDDLKTSALFSCSQFSSALTYLAMCCRTAAANIEHFQKLSSPPVDVAQKFHIKSGDKPEKNLFQLAMRSVSKSSQCLLAAIKNFVHDPNHENRFIAENFTNSVSAAVKAFAGMATSSKFVGNPSLLPLSIKMTRNTICGSCMNLISPTIQLLQTLSLLYSPSPSIRHRRSFGHFSTDRTDLQQRAISCITAIQDALSHLQQTLALYQNY